jgi:hypothetical protein
VLFSPNELVDSIWTTCISVIFKELIYGKCYLRIILFTNYKNIKYFEIGFRLFKQPSEDLEEEFKNI